jgi:hypothetical protein
MLGCAERRGGRQAGIRSAVARIGLHGPDCSLQTFARPRCHAAVVRREPALLLSTDMSTDPLRNNRPTLGTPRPPLAKPLTTHTVSSTKSTVFRSHFLKSHGRPPWYDPRNHSTGYVSKARHRYGEDGNPISDAFVIGIAGASVRVDTAGP